MGLYFGGRLFLFLFGAFICLVVLLMNKKWDNNKKIIVFFFSLYICSLIQFLLLPIPLNTAAISEMRMSTFEWSYIMNIIPFKNIDSMPSVILHIVIFLPLGGFVFYLSPRIKTRALIILAVPFFIEFFQGFISWYFGIFYKFSDINEFLFSVIGCVLGALVYYLTKTKSRFLSSMH